MATPLQLGCPGCPDSDNDGLADSLDNYLGDTGSTESDWDADNQTNDVDDFPTEKSQWIDSDVMDTEIIITKTISCLIGQCHGQES